VTQDTQKKIETPKWLKSFWPTKKIFDFNLITWERLIKWKEEEDATKALDAIWLKTVTKELKQVVKTESLNTSHVDETDYKDVHKMFGDISNHVKIIKLFKINPEQMVRFSTTDEI